MTELGSHYPALEFRDRYLRRWSFACAYTTGCGAGIELAPVPAEPARIVNAVRHIAILIIDLHVF